MAEPTLEYRLWFHDKKWHWQVISQLKDVLAAGEATLVTEGNIYRVDRPEVVPTREVASRLSRSDQRAVRVFATDECLRLHRAGEVAAA